METRDIIEELELSAYEDKLNQLQKFSKNKKFSTFKNNGLAYLSGKILLENTDSIPGDKRAVLDE